LNEIRHDFPFFHYLKYISDDDTSHHAPQNDDKIVRTKETQSKKARNAPDDVTLKPDKSSSKDQKQASSATLHFV
jgi:hypothetical protein